jgi:hypothetical protein
MSLHHPVRVPRRLLPVVDAPRLVEDRARTFGFDVGEEVVFGEVDQRGGGGEFGAAKLAVDPAVGDEPRPRLAGCDLAGVGVVVEVRPGRCVVAAVPVRDVGVGRIGVRGQTLFETACPLNVAIGFADPSTVAVPL